MEQYSEVELTKFVNGAEFSSPFVCNEPNQFSSFSGVDPSKNYETPSETVEAGNKYHQQKARTYSTRNLSKQRIESVMTQGLTLKAGALLLKVAPSTLKRYKKKFSLGDWPKSNRKLCNPEFGPANAPSESNSGISELSSDDSLLAKHDDIAVVPQEVQSHFPSVQLVYCPRSNDEVIVVAMKKSSRRQLVECGHISKPTPTSYVEAQIPTAFHSSTMELQYHSSELSEQEFWDDAFPQQQQPLSMDYAQVQAQLQIGEAPASVLFGSLPVNLQDHSVAPTQPGNFSYAPSEFASVLPSYSNCPFDESNHCYNILLKDTLCLDDIMNLSATVEVADHFKNNNILPCDLS